MDKLYVTPRRIKRKRRHNAKHVHGWFYHPVKDVNQQEQNHGWKYCLCGVRKPCRNIEASKQAQEARFEMYRDMPKHLISFGV